MTDAERNDLIEQCARAAEAQNRCGHEWVHDSLWANILRRAGQNVRKLKANRSFVCRVCDRTVFDGDCARDDCPLGEQTTSSVPSPNRQGEA